MIDSTLKNANILIVDDQEANINILLGLLDIEGYINVKSTTDPRDVNRLLSEFKPDLILLDLMMPHLSGFEVMDQIKPLVSGQTFIPILVLTADISPETRQKALSNGARDFLTKPFDLIEVGLRIKNLLEIKYLHQQLENQNQILEEKVEERTQELELSNKELLITRNKAEESNRLKTAFLNNISHEIRTPLNVILGFSPFVVEPGISQKEKEEYVSLINENSQRLINTVTDIMDMSLILSGNMNVKTDRITLFAIMLQLSDKFSGESARKNLEFKIADSTFPKYFSFFSDEELLLKALSHIVNNSLKFTKSGSITIGCEPKDDQIQFFVKDTGIGISEEAQKRILDAFMQENYANTRGHEGSGLGLSISDRIAKLLGGSLSIKSERNKGTTVFVTIPVRNTEKKPEIKSNPAVLRKKKLLSILIAEDDKPNYLYLETILKKYTNKLRRAETGAKTVEISRDNPDIDLILMDIKMPGMDGYEAVHQIRQFNKDVIIIAQTAYGLSGDRKKAIEAGFDDHISKPIMSHALVTLLDKYFTL